MHKAMTYIRDNEQSTHVIMVHVSPDGGGEEADDAAIVARMKESVHMMNLLYPKFHIDCLLVSRRGADRAASGVPCRRVGCALGCSEQSS